MTRNEQIIADRESGMNNCQLARKYGVSRQRICQICGKRRQNYFAPHNESHIYYNLRNWMNENRISITELCRRMGMNVHPETINRVSGWLRGIADPPKRYIDKLIEVTGMPYEVLFQKEE